MPACACARSCVRGLYMHRNIQACWVAACCVAKAIVSKNKRMLYRKTEKTRISHAKTNEHSHSHSAALNAALRLLHISTCQVVHRTQWWEAMSAANCKTTHNHNLEKTEINVWMTLHALMWPRYVYDLACSSFLPLSFFRDAKVWKALVMLGWEYISVGLNHKWTCCCSWTIPAGDIEPGGDVGKADDIIAQPNTHKHYTFHFRADNMQNTNSACIVLSMDYV